MQSLIMTPSPGQRRLGFVGDQLRFALQPMHGPTSTRGWRAFLRTNLGRARQLRHEIIHAHSGQLGLATSPWRDIPMTWIEDHWEMSFVLMEPGFFKAKAYALDTQGRQHWPEGPDFGISIHPDAYRTANTIYCAFARMFGATRHHRSTTNDRDETLLKSLETKGYAVLPPSGKLRDVVRQLPHIIDTLGCRILHLLPVHPTPTTYARFGRFGSPYACLDLMAIDPALVEFDKRTTGIDQFKELTYATHLRGGRVFLDAVINHTGWESTLQGLRPEWFVRNPDGLFISPGAWGVTWEDLVELQHRNAPLWEYLADVFLEWCRRGVDGFRCDAGYKIPVQAWRYIIARVQEEFPETIFLLEGLGGPWEATENLLTEGGMHWAYSELFQNYTADTVASYLDYCLAQSQRLGLYIHYSETHDNERLAQRDKTWSLMRNQLCALTSVNGGFGFTSGVEWLATEQIQVHQSRGLSWDNPDNLVAELARLNRLLTNHPCFFDQAHLSRLSPPDSQVYALRRVSAEGEDQVLILVNTDTDTAQTLTIPESVFRECGSPSYDLLSQAAVAPHVNETGHVTFTLSPGNSLCLAQKPDPSGFGGDDYRRTRAQAAWALQALGHGLTPEALGNFDWRELGRLATSDPIRFLASLQSLDSNLARRDLLSALRQSMDQPHFPQVILWEPRDASRHCPVPPNHWLLLRDFVPFQATLQIPGIPPRVTRSTPSLQDHIATFPPGLPSGEAVLILERYGAQPISLQCRLEFLSGQPNLAPIEPSSDSVSHALPQSVRSSLVLLTNQRGGMARLRVDLGQVQSKYDCVLGANLHPSIPVDRHIFVKRLRAWVNADGFITPLNASNLVRFHPGPPAQWCFVASAGDGRAVEIHLAASMTLGQNSTHFHFSRPDAMPAFGKDLPEASHVSLTLRFDILDRNFHFESHFNPGTESHFIAHTQSLTNLPGFSFQPAHDRHLRIQCTSGYYHPQPEWSLNLSHPIEHSRGQIDREDAFSPGWFEVVLNKGEQAVVTASVVEPDNGTSHSPLLTVLPPLPAQAPVPSADPLTRRLTRAVQDFLARRHEAITVIAGYPWFLDWGRDSLICARGLLAADLDESVQQLLITFGRFESRGTLPNTIHGEDTSNRDTSDAPLWFALVTEELAARKGPSIYDLPVSQPGRVLRDVLLGIAEGYRAGTPNGIRMDPESGLIWSPSHFTWMDTNHPAGTPREGYPVEIQALWIRLCRHLARLNLPSLGEPWSALADRAVASLHQLFWLPNHGYFADLLLATPHQTALQATPDNALRSNFLFAISLGLVSGSRACQALEAARHHLVLPGALRSLAPLPVHPPLPIRRHDGTLLNDPLHPYWGRYEGDEDTRRKPAYHNGTAWTWTFPVFCEALALAWNLHPDAVAAARAYLASIDQLLCQGCLGHLPEILDGDAPHTQRGCDAQAWSATEALRVWKWLQVPDPNSTHA